MCRLFLREAGAGAGDQKLSRCSPAELPRGHQTSGSRVQDAERGFPFLTLVPRAQADPLTNMHVPHGKSPAPEGQTRGCHESSLAMRNSFVPTSEVHLCLEVASLFQVVPPPRPAKKGPIGKKA